MFEQPSRCSEVGAVDIDDAMHFCGRDAVAGLGDGMDPVACADSTGREDTEVNACPSSLLREHGHVVDAMQGREFVAGAPRLGGLNRRRADAIDGSEDSIGFEQPCGGEVFAESGIGCGTEVFGRGPRSARWDRRAPPCLGHRGAVDHPVGRRRARGRAQIRQRRSATWR